MPFSSIRKIDHLISRGLMFSAGILLYGRTPLHVLQRGTVSDVVWTPYVQTLSSYRDAVDPEFILIDNKARQHSSHHIDNILESEAIRRIDRSSHITRSQPC